MDDNVYVLELLVRDRLREARVEAERYRRLGFTAPGAPLRERLGDWLIGLGATLAGRRISTAS